MNTKNRLITKKYNKNFKKNQIPTFSHTKKIIIFFLLPTDTANMTMKYALPYHDQAPTDEEKSKDKHHQFMTLISQQHQLAKQ